ncbi:MFS transporter [Thalassospira sp.]|uniref:MFS transporter n=1 Tax=Thalassospira sp. TaxID=1912094 RepID=UPI002736574A|nr:MFS transporter [Thalassospira sp.]MDP2697995.1 MFS transporter [Thalassospira sp.]
MTPFASSAFRSLFSAQVTALIGTGLTTVALSLLAYDLAGGQAGAILGSVLALKMVAYLVIAPVAGGMAHLVPRKIWLVGLDVVRAVVVLCLPFVDQIWQVFVLVFVVNAASAAFTPVFQALIPDILTDEASYTKGLSWARLAYDLESLASPVMAAVLLAFWQYDSLFLINGLTFVVSALLILGTPVPAAARTDRPGGFYANTIFGLSAYLKTPRLRGLLALHFAVSCVGAIIIVNTVVLTRSFLDGDAQLTTVFLACAGGGSMAAALLLPRFIDHIGERKLMTGGAVLAGLAILAASVMAQATVQVVWAYAMAWTVAGIGMSVAQTPGGRLVQRSAGAGDRPAYFAANFALSHGGWLFAYLLAGWVGSRFGLAAAFWVSGGVALLAVGGSLRLWPRHDPLELTHAHEGIWHNHDHDHDDPHHHHEHGTDGEDAHTHPHKHYHPPVVHTHRFVIDSHHAHWPVEHGERV